MVHYLTNEPPNQDGGAEQPLFLRVAAAVENDIIAGALAEGERVPSTNEIAAFARINPATALKGVAQLVADGIVEKRRGVGMFVTPGARAALLARRRAEFADRYLTPALDEARRLGLDHADVIALIAAKDQP